MWLRVCAFLPVLYLDESLLKKYGGHKGQLSQKYWGMDRFRIAALEKAINNELIDKNKRKAALDILLAKLNIFINGAKKRDKIDSEVNDFISKLEYYNNLSV
jgi:hypothetical protein